MGCGSKKSVGGEIHVRNPQNPVALPRENVLLFWATLDSLPEWIGQKEFLLTTKKVLRELRERVKDYGWIPRFSGQLRVPRFSFVRTPEQIRASGHGNRVPCSCRGST